MKQTLLGVAIALAALGLSIRSFLDSLLVVSAFLSAVFLAVVAEKVKTKFEHGYRITVSQQL